MANFCEYLFNLSFQKSIFPDHLKIPKVTPVFKAGNNTELSNYRSIFILPCFCKILDHVMFNCLCRYLLDSNIPYKRQSDFQEGHSADHAILQLPDKIHNNFELNNFTLGVSVDLSKAIKLLVAALNGLKIT